MALAGSGINSSQYHATEDKTGYSDVSDVHVGVPGDSFPAVAVSLDDIDSENNTDVEETEDPPKRKNYETEYVIQKLDKGGSRMEQIKRQLVVQRGAIVAALKMLRDRQRESCDSDQDTLQYFVPEGQTEGQL